MLERWNAGIRGEKLEIQRIGIPSSKSMIPIFDFCSLACMSGKWKIIKTHHG
jgi:hypothetical protein